MQASTTSMPQPVPAATPSQPQTSTTASVPVGSSTAATPSIGQTAPIPPSVVTGTAATAAMAVPIVVVRQQQQVKPYSGQSSWKIYKEYYERLSRTNEWTTMSEKVQHLALALEGEAAQCLKGIDENSDEAYEQIWNALSRRFGVIDEEMYMKRRFDSRRQKDQEDIPQFAMALNTLHKDAWPHASAEQRDEQLKRRFEEGLNSPEMIQYLRLHARKDNFEETVLKARQFVDASESAKPKRTSVRFATMPEQEFVSDTTVQSDLRPVIDELKQAITEALAERPRTHVSMVTDSGNQSQSTRGRSQTPGQRNTSPGPRSPSPGTRGTQSNRDRNQTGYRDRSPGPRYNGSRRNDSPGPRQGYDGQDSRSRPRYESPGPRRDYDQRFGQNYQPSGSRYDNRAPQYYGPPSPRDQRMVNYNGNQPRYGPTQVTQWRNGPPSGNGPQWDQSRSQSFSPRMGRRQRSCWVCGQVGCHSRNHPPEEQAPSQQQQFRQPSAAQQRQGRPSNNNAQAPGNNFRGPRMGTRTPSPARPAFQ